jgi:TRAP-type C4-dicarboxylate transport system permease small subunit
MEDKLRKKPAITRFLGKLTENLRIGSSAFLFLLLVGLTLIQGANIAMRYFFNQPIYWSNNISRYIYIYIVLIGTAVSYIEGGHAKVEFFYNAVSKKMKVVFDVLQIGIILFLFLVLTIVGTKHAIMMWPVHPPVLEFLSVGMIYLSIPISGVIVIVFLVFKFFDLFNKSGE